jgi:hypothetical protein
MRRVRRGQSADNAGTPALPNAAVHHSERSRRKQVAAERDVRSGHAHASVRHRTPNLCPPHWPRPRYGQIPVGSLLDEHAPRVRARWWTVDSRHYQAGQARYFAGYRAPGSRFVVGVMRRNGRASLRSRRATRWTTGSRSGARDVMARRRLGETVTAAGSARTRVRPAGDGGRVRA